MGGDPRSGSTEAPGPRVLALLEGQPGLTLDEVCAALGRGGAEPGVDLAVSLSSRDQRQIPRTRPTRLAQLERFSHVSPFAR